MPNPHDVLGPTVLDYEAWRDLLRSMCGRYYSEGIEPNAFAGWVRPVTTRGFTALDIGCNAHQVERTYRDVRLDGADHYFTLFQASGQSAMIHKDQAVRLAVGDVAHPAQNASPAPANTMTWTPASAFALATASSTGTSSSMAFITSGRKPFDDSDPPGATYRSNFGLFVRRLL
jgi:hypothetical protein